MPGPFVARDAQLRALRQLLDAVRGGQPRVAVIAGASGTGKTALIDRLLDEQPDVRVVRANGDEAEMHVPYAVADQLLRVAGAEAGLLGTAADHVGAGMQVLEALGALQDDRPVAMVIDDAQWADAESLKAVLFALRRLVADRVLAMIAVSADDLARLPEGLLRLADRDTGATIHVDALDVHELHALAEQLGVTSLSAAATQRLHEHTGGNPLYARALLTEYPGELARESEGPLPVPRSYEAVVAGRLNGCVPAARSLAQAAAVLGGRCSLGAAASVANVEDPLAALEAAEAAGLLRGEPGEVVFPHPLVRAGVYRGLGPARRAALHLAAAALAGDEWTRLRHRAAAAAVEDAPLAAELEAFADREAGRGAWALAAAARRAAGRLSATREEAERHTLRAVDAVLFAGETTNAIALGDELAGFAEGPLRDCVLGFLANMTARPLDAERYLRRAWEQCDPAADRELAATIARRTALHLMYRLRGEQTVAWSRRALELAGPDEPAGSPAELIPLGLGLGYAGRLEEGLEAVGAAMRRFEASRRGLSLRRARGWLKLVGDDLADARADLAEEARESLRLGSVGTAAFSFATLSSAERLAGRWDDAVLHAERALAITTESGHPFGRALAGLAAAAVTASRGDWESAERHIRTIGAQPGDYEHTIAADGLARAHLGAARADHAAVIEALAPLLAIEPREGIDEPGCWPWQDLYGDALISEGRLDEAAALLDAHEGRAAERGRRSMVARLVRLRGRLEAARGEHDAADASFGAAVEELDDVGMPFERALVGLAWGQALRRRGRRRAAHDQLLAARAGFEALSAAPYRERCDGELAGAGLAPAKRSEYDRDQLTPQELAVARLVASGMTNRQVAAELMVSVRTVEFHLTHTYAKLGIRSRAQLAARAAEQVLA